MIQWKQFQIHRARKGQRKSASPQMDYQPEKSTLNAEFMSPDAVQYGTVGGNPHVDVGHDDVVFVAFPFVREEQIGHPHFTRIV